MTSQSISRQKSAATEFFARCNTDLKENIQNNPLNLWRHLLRLHQILLKLFEGDAMQVLNFNFTFNVVCINFLWLYLERSQAGVGVVCKDGKFFDQSKQQFISCHECKTDARSCSLCCNQGKFKSLSSINVFCFHLLLSSSSESNLLSQSDSGLFKELRSTKENVFQA